MTFFRLKTLKKCNQFISSALVCLLKNAQGTCSKTYYDDPWYRQFAYNQNRGVADSFSNCTTGKSGKIFFQNFGFIFAEIVLFSGLPRFPQFFSIFPVLFLLKLSCAVFHWQFFLQIFQNPSVPLVDFSMDQQKLWIFADLQQKSANGKLIFPELPRFPKIFQFFRSTEPSEKESATPRLESSYFIMNPITLISF